MSLWTSNDAAITREVVGTATVTLGNTFTLTTGATTGMVVGDDVVGFGVPKGTKIASITNATVFVTDKTCTNAVGTYVESYGPDVNKPKGVNKRDKSSVYGADVNETQAKPITHAGWVKVTTGTGGRAGRVNYETLVASGSITGAALDDAILPTATIIIGALTTPVNLIAPAALSIAATVTGTTLGKKLSYVWSVSTDNVTFTTVAGAKSATLSVPRTVAGTKYYKVTASAGPVTTTSNTVTVVVA